MIAKVRDTVEIRMNPSTVSYLRAPFSLVFLQAARGQGQFGASVEGSHQLPDNRSMFCNEFNQKSSDKELDIYKGDLSQFHT